MISYIIKMNFKIKNITKKYSHDLFNLRNEKKTREFSLNKTKIKFSEHQKWFGNIKKKRNKIFIILLEKKNTPIGYTRFKIFKNYSEVSISIDKDYRNMGLSKRVLLASEKKIKTSSFKAVVNSKNIKSIALFKSLNYKEIKNYGGFIYMKKVINNSSNKYLKIIQQIENVRKKNNSNWMDILRIAFRSSPKETAKIMSQIYNQDIKVSKLTKKLSK
jgi:L-amino acid N-acyltransferase YncA